MTTIDRQRRNKTQKNNVNDNKRQIGKTLKEKCHALRVSLILTPSHETNTKKKHKLFLDSMALSMYVAIQN